MKIKLLILAVILIIFLFSVGMYKPKYKSDLNPSLKQKIAQMIIVHVDNERDIEKFAEMGIGGYHIGWLEKEEYFKSMIQKIKELSKIPPFIATDLEGCLNPFSSFKKFPNASDIKNESQAYLVGLEEGKTLKEFGFNMNFAPVLDLEDKIWKCRAFKGNASEIAKKGLAYIKGLKDSGILSIAKHYPGKSMATKDPHKEFVYATITEEDLLPFETAFEFGVDGVMVSHVIATGKVNSKGKPCSVSKEVIEDIKKKFDGLVISDDISMLGLKKHYENDTEMWVDLFKAGNDIIIISNYSAEKINKLIRTIEDAVKKGIISEKDIDNSVRKILKIKKLFVD